MTGHQTASAPKSNKLHGVLRARLSALLALAADSGLRVASTDADRLAATAEEQARRYARFFLPDRGLREAVLARSELADTWPLEAGQCWNLTDEGDSINALARIDFASAGSTWWHPGASFDDTAARLEHLRGDPIAPLLASLLRRGRIFRVASHLVEPNLRRTAVHFHVLSFSQTFTCFTDADSPSVLVEAIEAAGLPREDIEQMTACFALVKKRIAWHTPAIAAIAAVEKKVAADLRRPAIAIDAGRPHHAFLSGWSQTAKSGKVDYEENLDLRRVELVLPGVKSRALQLFLPLEGETLSQAFVDAIREWRGFLGLRHWAALQRLLSIEGGRSGRITWKLDEHLDALGLSKRWREDPENRRKVAEEVWLLTRMQLVIYDDSGKVRAKTPVLITTAEIEVERGGQWAREGLELQINPWLYQGVRNDVTGKLGEHWFPAPAELAQIDHDKHRNALALGLILPIRWRWYWADKGLAFLPIEAGNLLHLACIAWSRHDPGRAWTALRRALHELRRIGMLDRVEWLGPEDELASIVRLHPADWLLDRTVRGLRAIERPPTQLPTTGSELRAWRKARGWTQVELAKHLGVGSATVKRAEVENHPYLGRALTAALRSAGPHF